MATTDLVLLWITLYLYLQSCVAVRDRQIRCRRLSYDVLHQRCLPRSRRSLSRLLSWSSLLVLPPFQDVIRSLRAPHRFWAAPREQRFCEKDMCLLWRNMGKIYPDWEQNCYLQHFRMSKDMVFLPDLWQVFRETTILFAMTTCPSKEDCHCWKVLLLSPLLIQGPMLDDL